METYEKRQIIWTLTKEFNQKHDYHNIVWHWYKQVENFSSATLNANQSESIKKSETLKQTYKKMILSSYKVFPFHKQYYCPYF
jgi:hypothetical protein